MAKGEKGSGAKRVSLFRGSSNEGGGGRRSRGGNDAAAADADAGPPAPAAVGTDGNAVAAAAAVAALDEGSSHNHDEDELRHRDGGEGEDIDPDEDGDEEEQEDVPGELKSDRERGGAVFRSIRSSMKHIPGVRMPSQRAMMAETGSVSTPQERPSYRLYEGKQSPDNSDIDEDDDEYGSGGGGDDDDDGTFPHHRVKSESVVKAKHIESSAGTHRLQRIIDKQQQEQLMQQSQSQQQGGGGGGGGVGDPLHSTTHHTLGTLHTLHTLGGGGGGPSMHDPTDPNSLLLWNETLHPSRPRNLHFERLSDPTDVTQVARLVARVVLPPQAVDASSIGGQQLLYLKQKDPGGKDKDISLSTTKNYYPDDIMQQEVLCVLPCRSFESTGQETVTMSALQYPKEYTKHKRSLGLLNTGATSHAHSHHVGRTQKLRYVCLARSTTRPLVRPAISKDHQKKKREEAAAAADKKEKDQNEDMSEQGDYDTMFGKETSSFAGDESLRDVMSESSSHLSSPMPDAKAPSHPTDVYRKKGDLDEETDDEEEGSEAQGGGPDGNGEEKNDDEDSFDDEIASFPVLVCMTLNSDGTAPDIRKLIPLLKLTTIQNLHATVVQLAFDNGDTIRLDFATTDEKVAEASLDKERFIWSLIQIHSMLCLSVSERNSIALASANGARRLMLPPVNVRNLDRAELQYVATVNGFLKMSKILCALIDRQQKYLEGEGVVEKDEAMHQQRPELVEKLEMERRDIMAYELIMGHINMRVSLFQSEEERKDAEEILNSFEWTSSLSKEETAAVSVAERLGLMLQMRMRDLEAETCRRLIAWEDEKHFSATGQQKLFTSEDERDTVDALALASLFKTLEALDTELQDMEVWLQERAAAIKPLTDDCADIEEENRQLEQQWKSYDMLGSEMRRLLQGMDLDEGVEKILKNPASALIYDDGGRVDVDASEEGVDQIYGAGKALQEAIDYPRKSGGLHLDAVSERLERLNAVTNNFCTALAHIIVTIMEQMNEEVLAGSDYGKVSKNDTHAMIAKKVRDTQRKFQSALLGYIKLIEILSALSPEMLPALRDAYSEMVAESILMKKRMKGYFQALPGKNAAYMNKAGKDLKDYVAFDDEVLEMVNAPDIKAALSELLPVIAREAYFTSALFGAASKEQDGREKKRNFESTRKAVDNASQHFRYYIERTCGILPDQIAGRSTIDGGVKGDPLLCLVGSIYLNEAMDNYIDREKKGGDSSLSLAYVRASILDLRKKADKQWVGWVDKQIEWIRSNDGVPLTGKRAGIFPSCARFPSYLDHLLLACSEGREEGYVPDIVNIKVINYYLQKLSATLLESLKECAERESTDVQYAANVMQMENTYFFTQAIKHRNPIFADLFAKQVTKANAICKDSTDSYLGWMIKREFASLHELFSKVSKLRKELGDKQVPQQVPKGQFVRILQKEANKDVLKEKIGVMFSRMEKHLSEEGHLLPVAWKALVKVMYEWFGRWEKLCTQIYGYTLKPSAVDIVRIAKAAGGAAKPKQGSSSDFGFKSILALGNKNPT